MVDHIKPAAVEVIKKWLFDVIDKIVVMEKIVNISPSMIKSELWDCVNNLAQDYAKRNKNITPMNIQSLYLTTFIHAWNMNGFIGKVKPLRIGELVKHCAGGCPLNLIYDILTDLSNNVKDNICVKTKLFESIILPPESIKFTQLSKLRREWINEVSNWLSYPPTDAVAERCDLSKIFKNMNIISSIEKGSVSSSIMFMGQLDITSSNKKLKELQTLTRNSVIIKASFEPFDPWNNSLIVEQKIYENICKKLLYNLNTPHIMSYLGQYICDTHRIKLTGTTAAIKFKNAVDLIRNQGGHDTDKVSLLFLELSPGIMLRDLLSVLSTLNTKLCICFQILYTLDCFNKIGFRHNDFHFGNVFVEELEHPTTLYYRNFQGDSYVELTTKYICKIYDFDRSCIYYPGVPRNTEIDREYCIDFGQCNGPNQKRDLFFFMKQMYHSLDPSSRLIQLWMKNVVDIKWINNMVYQIKDEDLPTNRQLKPVLVALKSLLDVNWGAESPWVLKDGVPPPVVPRELIYRPPKEYKIQTWKPVSMETHGMSSKINKIKSKPPDEAIIERVEHIFNNDIQKNPYDLWYEELKQVFYYDWEKKTIELLIALEVIQPLKITNEIVAAAVMLACPYYHNNIREQIYGSLMHKYSEIGMYINSIWNLFNNTLPIEMPLI